MTPRQKQTRYHDQKFGEYIRKLRLERFPYHSGRIFAKEVGMTGPYLSNIERGVVPPPSPDKVIAIADKLGVDRQELLSMAGHADPEFLHAFRDAPKKMWQAAQFFNNLLKGAEIDLSFQEFVELFVGMSIQKARMLNNLESAQLMLEVIKYSQDSASLPDELRTAMDKGRSFIALNFPKAETDADKEADSRGPRSKRAPRTK
jgi:transcriptional regulator with XRE-family HTH domain